ncbi:polyphosphate kinase 2 family protein [Jiangella alba]|uniref:Polyphosphate:nucleotide phosphotransferase, PPK2 family n=1 Tax=Jiangella alba TaxID=561176 RepID=A0A1H5MFF7_9ACTN|nr:polyphosphate kinase 2 family protein [Jiangella alba]SEE88122.1 polyphosphate:nucleotide phosphotransferase, PPK2 family [Jiangella alba]
MDRRSRIVDGLRVRPGQPADLAGRDPRWSAGGELGSLAATQLDATARELLREGVSALSDAQELLWASDRYALLVVFQAMDAAGKDSAIEHVMSGVNPQGVDVVGFRKPSAEELDHTYLWRIAKAVPERGRIGIFNRSHYEEVIALRVHPEWLDAQKLPDGDRGPAFWAARYEDINAFERHLDRNGTRIVKFFLHVSKDEQHRRFMARLDNPDKQWKFNAADVAERALWEDYQAAYEAALSATSTAWAPWYVVPADQKSVTQALVAAVLLETIEGLDLQWPVVSAAARESNARAREVLEAERVSSASP